MRLPMRWIGTAASGYSAAAIRLSSQSRYSIEPTRPITVTASATPLTVRVSASRMIVASVVKRAASCAGASRSSRARSACVRCANMRPCSSRITSSTICCTCTFWKYWAAALIEVMATTSAGIWYRMRRSRSVNIWNAWSITTGYSAVVPAIRAVSTSTSSRRGLWWRTCSRHNRASSARVESRPAAKSRPGVTASMASVYQRRRGVASAAAATVQVSGRLRSILSLRIRGVSEWLAGTTAGTAPPTRTP